MTVNTRPAFDYATPPETVIRAGGYGIECDSTFIGWVYQPRKVERSGWSFRNDSRGWYGEGLRTRRQAIALLLELATR